MYTSHILNDTSRTKEKHDYFDDSTYAISRVMRILVRRSYLHRVRMMKCSNANRIFEKSFQKSVKPFGHHRMREIQLRFGTGTRTDEVHERIRFSGDDRTNINNYGSAV